MMTAVSNYAIHSRWQAHLIFEREGGTWEVFLSASLHFLALIVSSSFLCQMGNG